jgi:hypothetical protein
VPVSLWVVAVLIPDLALTCILMRWLPVKRERWIVTTPLPGFAVMVLFLHFAGQVSWPETLSACTGFICGTVVALLPFRSWISSWTLPVTGEARLRWHEAALVLLGAMTPLSPRRTKRAMEKAFAPRQVIRPRGQFPPAMGMTLLVIPVLGAVGTEWGTRVEQLSGIAMRWQ